MGHLDAPLCCFASCQRAASLESPRPLWGCTSAIDVGLDASKQMSGFGQAAHLPPKLLTPDYLVVKVRA
eukprot:350024-Chlamydomonas_euryale.AAC.3